MAEKYILFIILNIWIPNPQFGLMSHDSSHMVTFNPIHLVSHTANNNNKIKKKICHYSDEIFCYFHNPSHKSHISAKLRMHFWWKMLHQHLDSGSLHSELILSLPSWLKYFLSGSRTKGQYLVLSNCQSAWWIF